MSPEEKVKELGLEIPSPPPAVGTYVGAVEHSGLLFVSGHGPYRDGGYDICGKVGGTVSVDEAREAARVTIINALGSVREALGSLDRVERVVKMLGMVNSAPDFTEQPWVIDAASDLLVQIFGDGGPHARSAVGLCSLPMGIPVEIEMVLGVRPAA